MSKRMLTDKVALPVNSLVGDPLELKWNKKDLESLKAVLPLVPIKRIAVQAGGCLGVFAKYLAAHFEHVYTFEPSPLMFPTLVWNVPEKNVTKLQMALGAKREMVEPVCKLRGNDGKTSLHCGMTHLIPGKGFVPTIKLDDIPLPVCDLIYLDVEGYELFALQGARETIIKHKPVIACEINRGIEYFGISGDDLRTHIRLLGYRFQARHRSDEVWVHESRFKSHAFFG